MLCEHGNIAPCVECDVEPLKTENEALWARVAELESQPAITQLSELMRGLEIGPGMAAMPPHIFYLLGKKIADQAKDATDSAILRKQAGAVDDIRKDLLIDMPVHAISKAVDLRLGLRVDSLREKADEAERVGGEQ